MASAALRPHPYHLAAALPKSHAPLCKFWLQGRCNRGHNCRFSHHSPSSAATATAVAGAAGISQKRSSYTWRRPIEAPPLVDREPPVEEEEKVEEKAVLAEEDLEAPPSPQSLAVLAEEAPPSSPQSLPPVEEEEEAVKEKAEEEASLAAATVTGVSAMNWPEVLVTKDDGIIFSKYANHLEDKPAIRKLRSQITCLVKAPMHPAFLLLGFASGDIGVMLCGDPIHPIHIVPRPSQPCGKVLCLASARTTHHSFLLMAAYENGAILCWARNPHSTTLSFSALCILHHPGAPPVLSMDISQVGVVEEHRFLYCASANGSITVWDLDMWSCSQVLQSGVPLTKILAAGTYLFVGSSDGSIRAWGPSPNSIAAASQQEDLSSSQKAKMMVLLYTQPSPRQAATAVVDMSCQAIEGDRHVLYVAYRDHTVSVWDLPSFKELDVLRVPFGINAMDLRRIGGGQGVIVLAGDDGMFFATSIPWIKD